MKLKTNIKKMKIKYNDVTTSYQLEWLELNRLEISSVSEAMEPL